MPTYSLTCHGTMTTYFDYLPLEDVIHESIFPYLDYESRIQMNRVLPPIERYRTRFSKDEIVRHELYVVTAILKSKLNSIETVCGSTRKIRMRKKSQRLLQMLQLVEPETRNVIIMQHYPSFHTVIIDKLTSLSDPYSDDLRDASKYFRQKIVAYARVLLPRVQSIVPAVPMKGRLQPLPVRHMSSCIV